MFRVFLAGLPKMLRYGLLTFDFGVKVMLPLTKLCGINKLV